MFNNSSSHKPRRALCTLVLTLATALVAPGGALAASATGHGPVSASHLLAPTRVVVVDGDRSLTAAPRVAPRSLGGQTSAPFTPPWGTLDVVRFAMIALIGVVLLLERAPHRR